MVVVVCVVVSILVLVLFACVVDCCSRRSLWCVGLWLLFAVVFAFCCLFLLLCCVLFVCPVVCSRVVLLAFVV